MLWWRAWRQKEVDDIHIAAAAAAVWEPCKLLERASN